MNRIFFTFVCSLYISIGSFSLVFAEKNILITAATSELGQEICKNLASKGYRLILAARSLKKLQRLKGDLEKAYAGKYEILIFDYKELSSIQVLENKIEELDGLVLIPPRANLPSSSIPTSEQWTEALRDTFVSPLEFVRVLATTLKPESSIVIISGLTSVQFMPQYQNSNVLKIMWSAEVKNLSVQLSDKKVRINMVSPGVILTPHNIQKITERGQKESRSYEDQLQRETADTPLRRYGHSQDVAQSIAFLLGDDSKHTNGTNMVIDGGFNRSY